MLSSQRSIDCTPVLARASDETHYEGITFWGRHDHLQVVNYPKLHYDNGVVKNRSTAGEYKPSVRMLKNARRYLVEHGDIDRTLAPWYSSSVRLCYHNIPDQSFVADPPHF